MKPMLPLSLFAAVAATAVPALAQQKLSAFAESYRSNYVASCTSEFGNAQGASAARGAEICSCVATTLVGNLDDKQLQNLDDQIAGQGTQSDAFSAIQQIAGECGKAGVPAQVEKNPKQLGASLGKLK